MKKSVLISLVASPLILLCVVLIAYKIYNYEKIHRCDEPYMEVCIDGHTETKTKMVPASVSVGGVKMGKFRVVVQKHFVCDIYEMQLKPSCEGKDEINVERNSR